MRSAQEPRCLWPKRDCYPPANLWYRISLGFLGSYARAFDPGEIVVRGQLVGRASIDGRERWELESNTAVRLTLRCVDRHGNEPFLVRRRINGKRRTIGGCARNAPDRFGPTVRFATNATGEMESWRETTTAEPYTSGNSECQGFTDKQKLISSHGLLGQISTGSSLTDPVELGVGWHPPSGTGNAHEGERRCVDSTTGAQTFYEPPRDVPIDDLFPPLLGSEYLYRFPGEAVPWRPGWFRVRFHFSAPNFGSDWTIQREARQPQLEPGSYPRPPTPPHFETWEKDYVYTLRFEPCPNRGLDVEHC